MTKYNSIIEKYLSLFCLTLILGFLLELPFYLDVLYSDAYLCQPILLHSWLGCFNKVTLWPLLLFYFFCLCLLSVKPHLRVLILLSSLSHFLFYGQFYSYYRYFNTGYVLHNNNLTFFILILFFVCMKAREKEQALRCLRLPLVLCLFSAGLAKLSNTTNWLSGHEIRYYLQEALLLWDRTWNKAILSHPEFYKTISVLTLVFELGSPIVFIGKKCRALFIVTGIVFHTLTYFLIGANFFPGFIALYVLLLEPESIAFTWTLMVKINSHLKIKLGLAKAKG